MRATLATLAVLAAGVVGTSAIYLGDASPAEQYGPPVAPASIVTLSPADEASYYGPATPDAEQGEGGPDTTPPPAPWAVPAGECADVRRLLAGVDPAVAERLVWIARAESSCGERRVNRTSGDYGLWQVNWSTWAGPLCDAGQCVTPWLLAHDDGVQLEAVLTILGWQGWSAWCWSTPDHHARGIGYACPWPA